MTATSQISGYISSSGCGPFGIWENSNSGEVATEIEMRLNTRLGVFAMAEGKVVEIQTSTSPFENGEVEGVFVKYGENFVIKYAHVKDPIVHVGDSISMGQKIGSTVLLSNGSYFWEAELREKSGNSIYAKPWNAYLTNAALFNSLYGSGNCTTTAPIGTDGRTTTTVTNWVNNNLVPAQWDMTSISRSCVP